MALATRRRLVIFLGGLAALGLAMSPDPAAARSAVQGSGSTVDFERHIMGLFGRMGCNAGACHGSFQGKGGFRLSLFGYDSAKDYFSLTRDMLGRRINRVNPEQSLILLKPTGQIAHGGGRRFGKDSWQYRLLRDWIVAGAPWRKGSGTVTRLTITPPECQFRGPGQTSRLTVRARFRDGSQEDITRFCEFRTNNDAVAEVTPAGVINSVRPGDTVVIVSYRGQMVPVRVLVPAPLPPGRRYPPVPEINYIDHEVFAKLRRLNIVPSDLSSDTEFLRRVTIDTIGALPSPEEVRAFLADRRPDKRVRKIDALLAHPMHAALWATKFCDITGNNTDVLEQPREKHSKMWHDWFRKRIADNMPYDEIVRGVLCATSRDGLSPQEWLQQRKETEEAAQKGFDTPYASRPSLDLFWRRQNGNVPLQQWGEKTAAAFLGIRLECAQCHKHPFDRWTQADYRSYANIFGQVQYGLSPEVRPIVLPEKKGAKKKAAKVKPKGPPIREVFIAAKARALPDPDTRRRLPARALGGPIIDIEPGEDARVELFDWMRSPNNPYFARSFVNRVWGHYFGVGLVDPVDDFSLANPPSNQRLLDALARDFVTHHYNIRRLERTILSSRTYQLAALPNASNRLDHTNYSHSYVRRMMAEVVEDVLNTALGVTDEVGKGKNLDGPPGIRAIEVAPSRVRNGNLAYVFRIFGRPPRTSACDCQRAMEPALPQTLYLMTDPTVMAKLQHPRGRLKRLLAGDHTDEEILEELFLATLSRFPTATDRRFFAEHRAAARNRQAAFIDTLWALINTREFILNH